MDTETKRFLNHIDKLKRKAEVTEAIDKSIIDSQIEDIKKLQDEIGNLIIEKVQIEETLTQENKKLQFRLTIERKKLNLLFSAIRKAIKKEIPDNIIFEKITEYSYRRAK
jgi:hypothetical protein